MIRFLALCAALLSAANGYATSSHCKQSFSYSNLTETNFEFVQTRKNRLSQQGQLGLKKLNKDDGGQWWGLQFSQLSLKTGRVVEEDKDLIHPFAFRLDEQGLVNDFWFIQGLNQQGKDKIKGFSYLLQHQQTENSVNEKDALGEYSSYYQFKNDEILKQKQHYLAPTSKLQPEVLVEASFHRYKQHDCFLAVYESDERLVVSQNKDLVLNTAQQNTLTLIDDIKGLQLWQLPNNVSHWKLSLVEEKQALTEEQINAQKSAVYNGLLSFEGNIPKASLLVEWLNRYPAGFDSITELLREQGLSTALEKRLFLAMGLLDTEPAQTFLQQSINNDDLTGDQRFRAIRGLTQGTGPLSESVLETIDQQLAAGQAVGDDFLNNSWIMAVGTVVANRADTPGIELLENRLTEQMQNSATVSEQAMYVAALGNTQSDNVVPAISAVSTSEAEVLRKSAAMALGRIGNTESQTVMQNMLLNESQGDVKAALFTGLSQFPANDQQFTQIAFQSADNDGTTGTRRAAVAFISSQINSSNADIYKPQLKALLKTESNRSVYKSILEAIYKK